jgi:hypothetical protein
VRGTRYYARVVVNGHVVCTSPGAQLTFPAFTAPLQLAASIALHRRPRLVEFELWEVGWVVDTRVACVPVPIPLAFTAESVPVESVEPYADWVDFTATSAMGSGTAQFVLPPAAPLPHAITPSRWVVLLHGGGVRTMRSPNPLSPPATHRTLATACGNHGISPAGVYRVWNAPLPLSCPHAWDAHGVVWYAAVWE